jgi:DNA-binding beta-propeller fold protein YncE
VFVTEPEGYRVLEFNSQGEFVRTWGDFGDGPGDFNLPTGIALDPNGGLWVTDTGNHRVMHFSVP